MVTNTHVLFSALLQGAGADCICDIGSRDGEDALRLRNVFPNARILAFEANPHNHALMAADPRFAAARIELFSCAVSNSDGEASFNITPVTECDPHGVSGTSSLLGGSALGVQEVVRVETRRLDGIIAEHCPGCRQIGLWVDTEGAEYMVFEGMSGIREHVAAIHVETAIKPFMEGQRPMAEVTALLDSMGFEFVGAGFTETYGWGDAVYVNRAVRTKLGDAYEAARRKARLSAKLRVDLLAGFLKRRLPWLHRIAYRFYHRIGTKRGS
jgi:FkbM family methyltransferase